MPPFKSRAATPRQQPIHAAPQGGQASNQASVASGLLKPVCMVPHWQTADGLSCRLYLGHVLDVLAAMPEKSVHCCITSPPYWGLRSYLKKDHPDKKYEIGQEPLPDCKTDGQAQCGRCFVCTMVEVFRAVRRVLRDDGTCWLNLGDTYGATNLPPGNLVGVPWRVALALQADGWILRQDIIWSKPSPMPESVKNRCTKSHEYVFLLTRSTRYYYDAEAIKDPAAPSVRVQKTGPGFKGKLNHTSMVGNGVDPEEVWGNGVDGKVIATGNLSNKRSVWRVASFSYPGAHFAVYPPKLVEPCLLAGTSEKGCCGECGAPWRRLVERVKLYRDRPNDYVKRTGEAGTGNHCNNTVAGVEVRTLGWEPTCNCVADVELGEDGFTEHPVPPAVVPCTVLDPFVGSGTTACVALEHGRRSVGIDLSEQYLRENAAPRIEGKLRALGMTHLIPPAANARPRMNLGNNSNNRTVLQQSTLNPSVVAPKHKPQQTNLYPTTELPGTS
jgi:DNA modification methylase